jgi:endonuclease-3
MDDLRRRFYADGDGHAGTALGKITAETDDPFRVLISTILSQRTRDAMTAKASAALYARYPSPEALAEAPVEDIEALIRPVGFYRRKAGKIKEVARVLLEQHGGRVPDDYDALVALPQVGPKTANCVLVYGYGRYRIPVDVHVWRIANRLGLVATKTPEETEAALARFTPKALWLDVNELFVRFGQDICRPVAPRCDRCSFPSFCRYYREAKA